MHRQRQRARGREAGENRRRPHHVVLHLAHRRGGLERDAARIERDPLADQDDGGAGLRRRVLAHEEHRRPVAARVDAEQSAHLLLLDRALVEDTQPEPLARGQALRLARKLEGTEVVARRVADVARPAHGLRDGLGPAGSPVEGARAGSGRGDDDRPGAARLLAGLRLVPVEGVVRQGNVGQQGPDGLDRNAPVEAQHEAAARALRDAPHRPAQGRTQACRRRRHGPEAAERPPALDDRLAGLARETRGLRRRSNARPRRKGRSGGGIAAFVQEGDPGRRAARRHPIAQSNAHDGER